MTQLQSYSPRLSAIRFLIRAMLALAAVLGFPSKVAAEPKATAAFDHREYDALLRKYVNDGGAVDYAGLLANRQSLDDYVARLGSADPEAAKSRPRNERLAFYINAYNAITLQRILDHYPPRGSGIFYPRLSIRNISGVWDRLTTPVLGKELTLEHIEHKILRPEFGDARIHMAIVCASKGCPILSREAYVAPRLEEQLDQAARLFAEDAGKNKIDPARGKITLSPIFKWFAEDFHAYSHDIPSGRGSQAGALGFLARYSNPATAQFIREGSYTVRFGDYDWSLNAQ